MRRRFGLALAALGVACLAPTVASAQIDARMFRYPDVSATHIAFVYGGDIWTVPRAGGLAVKLSSPAGEESFPRFSPDGSRLAFTANYDGNDDVYVVPAMGGDPVRLTHHPGGDRVQGWHPDGQRVLFTSSRESGRQRYSQFYLVPAKGGLPEKMVIPYGEFGAFSPDGKQFAYLVTSQDFRTWKRYRGGDNSRIWLFDLSAMKAEPMVPSPANSTQPMFHGDKVYFSSDRGPEERMNLWVWERKTGNTRQITKFTTDDITFPAIGPNDIVFQAGGTLYLMDLASEKVSPVKVQVVTDQATLKPRVEKVQSLIMNGGISPTGKRAYFEARGDVFSVPAEHGPVVNLTRSSGVAERYPAWSPDGKTLAYWSDRSGEYELTVRPADGLGAEKTLTKIGSGFRYNIHWSPDSKHVAFFDEGGRLWRADVTTGALTKVAESPLWMSHGPLQGASVSWSADSRWLAFDLPTKNTNNAVYLHDTTTRKTTQVTSAYFNDTRPTFDPEGKFLYYRSNREFRPVYGDFDNSWTYPNSMRLIAVPLRRDVKSPLAARNDMEGEAK
ncbi:MAG: PD40 domain-containing protein, partial [Vicinamibacteraceae bacterium]|nr:PD40 domain-containing protein [Vicinamibacteraceae bacterium]